MHQNRATILSAASYGNKFYSVGLQETALEALNIVVKGSDPDGQELSKNDKEKLSPVEALPSASLWSYLYWKVQKLG